MKMTRISPLSLFVSMLLFVVLPREAVVSAVLSMLCHEAAHAIMGRMFNMRIHGITILPLGISIEMTPAPSYISELLVALSGPIMNGVICAFAYHLGQMELFFTSMALGALNLMPICPLDGGAALRAAACLAFGERTADIIVNLCGMAALSFLYICAIYVLFYSTENFALIAFVSYMFVLFCIKRDKSFKS